MVRIRIIQLSGSGPLASWRLTRSALDLARRRLTARRPDRAQPRGHIDARCPRRDRRLVTRLIRERDAIEAIEDRVGDEARSRGVHVPVAEAALLAHEET